MTYHLIILEGADRVGKSTYAQTLAEQTGYPIEHFGKPDQEIITHTERYFYQYDHLFAIHKNRILDRSWISRILYTTLRDNLDINLQDFYDLHDRLSKIYTIDYIFMDRQWDDNLEKEHLLEIQNKEGYGTLEERKREHFAFRLLHKLLSPTPLAMQEYRWN